jgi:hypothetical protein
MDKKDWKLGESLAYGIGGLFLVVVTIGFISMMIDAGSEVPANNATGNAAAVPTVVTPVKAQPTVEPTATPRNVRLEIETAIKAEMNRKLAKDSDTFRCTGVHLAGESIHKYNGYAEFSDGTKNTIEATIDDDGTMIWTMEQ